MADEVSFPRLWSRTQRWTLGEPRSISVTARPDGGARILFLRSMAGDDPRTGLWLVDAEPAGGLGPERLLIDPQSLTEQVSEAEQARRERVRESASGVVSFSHDRAAGLVVTYVAGELLLVDADAAIRQVLPVDGDVFDPRIDPTGRFVAYCSGPALRVLDIAAGSSRTVAGQGEPDGVTWGRAEHAAAEEMGRSRGFWWSPDGDVLLAARADERAVMQWWIADPANPAAPPRRVRYPAAGTANAEVTLWRVPVAPGDADPDPIEIAWDHAEFEYLAAVGWWPGQDAVAAVASRDQRRLRWLGIGPDGSTEVLAEDTADPWVTLHAGAPAGLGGELVRIADVDGRRRLFLGNRAVSPPELHVDAIETVLDDAVLVSGWFGDPASREVWRIGRDGSAAALTADRGVHAAVGSGQVVVLTSASLEQSGARVDVLSRGRPSGRIGSSALPMPPAPNLEMFRTEAGISVGVVLPRGRTPGRALPILMDPYGGPHFQRVTAARRAWLEAQWWADQGFAVVVADGRGTPGVSPAFEAAIWKDVARVVLADQVDALGAAAQHCNRRGVAVDTDRVAIRGWSFGGYLAALAVLRRPDVFQAAVAGAPPTDWRLYDTFYTERYLGIDAADPAYDEASLIGDAGRLTRPLLLVHGMADDNVVVAHTLQLSRALTEAGRPHSMLPLSGITHMATREDVAENLLLLQRDFIRRSLGLG